MAVLTPISVADIPAAALPDYHPIGPTKKPKKWIRESWMERELTERYTQDYTRNDKRLAIIDMARRFDVPEWVVKRWAQELGLARTKEKPWSKQEVAYLCEWMGRRNPVVIARHLRRTTTAVIVKSKRLKLSRVLEGYTLRQLCEAFGEDHHKIHRWIDSGMLRGSRRGTARTETQGGDMWLFKDKDIVHFIRTYPLAFNLRKVDQLWFLELTLGLTTQLG
jgi:hypothetical protein